MNNHSLITSVPEIVRTIRITKWESSAALMDQREYSHVDRHIVGIHDAWKFILLRKSEGCYAEQTFCNDVLKCENPHPSRLDKMIEMITCGQGAAPPLSQLYSGEYCSSGFPTMIHQRVDWQDTLQRHIDNIACPIVKNMWQEYFIDLIRAQTIEY